MKRLNRVRSGLVALFLGVSITGCATVVGTNTDFKAWRGDDVYVGNGGAVEVHDGVEFWEMGEPTRPFKIVGIISQTKGVSPGHQLLFTDFNRDQIMEIVKREQADGVILLQSEQFVSGYSTQIHPYGHPHATTRAQLSAGSVLAAFKYEP